MITTVLATFFGLTHAADVIVFGDSWGVYGRRAFADLMERQGLTVDNHAIAGTTAANWASNGFQSSLRKAIDQNKDAKYVWLTIGGNDAIPKMMAGEDIHDILAQVVKDTRVFLDETFRKHPNIKIVQFGYDLFDWENENGFCTSIGYSLSNKQCGSVPAARCQNSLFVEIQKRYVDEVTKYYPNHTALNLLGSLQVAEGIPRAKVGSPNLDEWSPHKFVDPSCIHLTEEGYEIIFEELWNRYFAKEEAKRKRVKASSLKVSGTRGSGGRSGAWRPGQYVGMAFEQVKNSVRAFFNWLG